MSLNGKGRRRVELNREETPFRLETRRKCNPPQNGRMERLRSLMRSQLAVSPRLMRVTVFIMFDSIVIGELLLWNSYLAYVMVSGLQMNDFGKFYYSAVAYLNGGDLYGPNLATLHQLDGPHLRHFWNLNPPHFHIPLLGLALLRPGFAMAVWGIMSLASLALSWILIIKETHIDP